MKVEINARIAQSRVIKRFERVKTIGILFGGTVST